MNQLSVGWPAKIASGDGGLATLLLEMLPTVPIGQIRRESATLFLVHRVILMVFLVLPRPERINEAQYREARRNLLIAHRMVVKHLNPLAEDICGIAVNPIHAELSEDIGYLDARFWPQSLADEARHWTTRSSGYFSAGTRINMTNYEYPIDASSAKE